MVAIVLEGDTLIILLDPANNLIEERILKGCC